MLLAFHKPYDVLSQFTQEAPGQRTLAQFGFPPRIYPIGRLDRDSEGLLLLTDERDLVDRLLNPRKQHPRCYQVQVDGEISESALAQLRAGVRIQDYQTLPCSAVRLHSEPRLPARIPPIRVRLSVPTSWIEMELCEGKNRQVRRMTAAVGHPTLRLVRTRIGKFQLGDLPSGEWTELDGPQRSQVLS